MHLPFAGNWLLGVLAVVPASPSLGQLAAEQLALVYNANASDSKQLAADYARVRGVPADRLIGLNLPASETISRHAFFVRCVEPLRAELVARGLADRVRCLVTFYDVPLRVEAARPTTDESALASRLDGEYAAAVPELLGLCAVLDRLGVMEEPATAASQPAVTDQDLKTLVERYQRSRIGAGARVVQYSENALSNQLKARLLEALEKAEGVVGLIRGLHPASNDEDPRARQRFVQMQEYATRLEARLAVLLDHPPTSAEREEARRVTRSCLGLLGYLSRLDHDRRQLRGQDTVAALDSELTLLWYESYPAYLWLSNPDHPRTRLAGPTRGAVESPRPGSRPVPGSPNAKHRVWGPLMVSRLDGANPAIVRRLFEDAVAVEKRGLSGRAYVDASADKTGPGYGGYNDNLVELATLLQRHTSLPVTLDAGARLFAPGDCPQTALYCGWYSHMKYVPAFEFLPGSVGYHIASSEAASLRRADKQYWCKRMLDDGIAATLGPVHEPYLSAFPLPTEFFGLLLGGRYSLAECYHLTNPLLSWMMVLVGDPLYRPFAANPRLSLEAVFPPELRALLMEPMATASGPVER